MINFTADHMDARLKICQSYKIKTGIWSFLVIKLNLVTLKKLKKSKYRKAQFIELQKYCKGKHKVNAWAAISRTEKIQHELFTYNMDTNVYLYILKKNIKVFRKMETKTLVLIWDYTPTHDNNKTK